MPPHILRIDFALDAPGWDSLAIDALSDTVAAYADVFSISKLDYGECFLRSSEVKVPTGTQPLQSRPYRLNPVLSKQVDAILDSKPRGRPHSTLHVAVVEPPCVRPKQIGRHPHYSQLPKAQQSHRDPPNYDSPRRRDARHPRRRFRFSPCSTFSLGLLS